LLVFLMTVNYLNFFLFVILLILPDLLGVYYLREEFIANIKKDFKIKSGKREKRHKGGTRGRC
jgi:hypothetical protein